MFSHNGAKKDIKIQAIGKLFNATRQLVLVGGTEVYCQLPIALLICCGFLCIFC